MNALTKDRLTLAVLALAFILLIVALFAVIVHNDARIQRWQNRIDELETERDDARAELAMWQGTLTRIVEGDVNFKPRISDKD